MMDKLIMRKVKDYAHMGLDYFEKENKGKIILWAKADKNVANMILEKYLPQLDNVNPATLGLIKWYVSNNDVVGLLQPVIEDIIRELKLKPSEMGDVARSYPDWLRDQIRRLLNLAILHLKGDNVCLLNSS